MPSNAKYSVFRSVKVVCFPIKVNVFEMSKIRTCKNEKSEMQFLQVD